MFTKLVLPKLGGTPAVWSVAMVFFQAVLLTGYAYAHVITTWLTPRRAAFVHLSMMGLIFALALPMGLPTDLGQPPEEGQALWLVGIFAVSVGLPFFAISANGPLLQAWFARTGHSHATDPYFLYGASNIGSLLALLSYPFLIEPSLPLSEQVHVWTSGFALLIVGVAIAAGLVGRIPPTATVLQTRNDKATVPGWGDRATWTALAFVPSALLVAVTAFVSTDVAAAPLLWVIPLALFLLSFIIVFQRKPFLRHDRMLSLHPIVVGFLLAPVLLGLHLDWQMMLPLHLVGFFLTAMVCHGEMAKRRPPAQHLTEFYMWMSFGGVLGGLFAGLLAPHLFSSILEYPLLLASILCHPGLFEAKNRSRTLKTIGFIVVAGGMIAVALFVASRAVSQPESANPTAILIGLSLVLMLQFKHPARLAGLSAAVFLILAAARLGDEEAETIRSFYGVHRVATTSDGQFRLLSHGTTLHGAQKIRDENGRLFEGPLEAITYNHTSGNISHAIEAIRAAQGRLNNVSVIGVGTGSLACRRQAGESWTFYEIDRTVINIVKDSSRFTFLSSCAPDAPIVLGDARLTVAGAEDGSVDLLIVDAFSSDAIPIHLMTQEAIALYVRKLSARGSLVLHISNRNMELASVVAAVGGANGLAVFRGGPEGRTNVGRYITDSEVVVLSRSGEDVGDLATRSGWQRYEARSGIQPWTDDYADVIGAVWRRMRPHQ
ncbi:class I SAM-dependent methyltransferase [Microvirga aerophila]